MKLGDIQGQQTQSSLRDTSKGLLPEFGSGIFLSSVMGNIHCVLSAELPAEPLTAGRTGTSVGEAWGEWDRVAETINKSCSDYAVSYPGKNILLEGCENSLINYRCSPTYHILYFEVLNIHISTCYICVEVFVKLFQCFFMILSTKMLSRIKMGVC